MTMRMATVLLAAALAATFALSAAGQAPPKKKPGTSPPVSQPVAAPVKPKSQASALDATRRKSKFDQLVRERERAGNEARALAISPQARQAITPASSSTRNRASSRQMVFSAGTDCDDTRADVYPGASEICDGRDNNCDGRVDEGQTLRFFLDADGDGHGDPRREVNACPADQSRASNDGAWLVLVGNDCDDTNPDTWRDCN